MTKIIHGHAILDILKERSFSSRDELKEVIKEKLGDVNFTNCSKKEYTFDEIMDFFEQKGKIIEEDNLLKLRISACSCPN